MRRYLYAVLAVTLLFSTPAAAAPIQLDSTTWATLTSGASITTETFASYAFNSFFASGFTFSNGTYSTDAVGVDPVFIGGCNATLTQCLGSTDGIDNRVFSNLPAGTTVWSVGAFDAYDPDVFQITVVGGSGTSVFSALGTANFLAFGDPLGLLSVSFLNKGNGSGYANYMFDNISTAAVDVPTPVPEPATITLLVGGLAAAGVRTVRRRPRSS